MADSSVNLLRTDAGRDISDLVGELSTRSEEFRVRWAKHDVRLHHTGTKSFHHPVVGDIDVTYETMPLPADPGLAPPAAGENRRFGPVRMRFPGAGLVFRRWVRSSWRAGSSLRLCANRVRRCRRA
jgi:hypothetical protein